MSDGGEVALWSAVIYQAFQDAITYPAPRADRGHAMRVNLDRYSARTWISECGEDFRTVCGFIGVEPRWARKRLLASMARDDATRVAAAKDSERVTA